mgnify:CR=1 FL=1
MIAILDYGVGNLFSLRSSLQQLGLQAVVTADAAAIRAADRLILPGVGAFGDAMAKLTATGLVPVLKEHGVEAPFEKVVTVVGMMKDRVSFVKELWEVCSFFFVAPTEYDEKTVKKRWKEDSAKCMTELAEVLAGIEDFSIEGQEKIVMDWIAEKGYHTGNIMNAFRLTLVGEGKGPHMFDISWVLGKEETLARMKRAVEVLK